MNQTSLFTLSMRQYIVDTIMPTIVGGIHKVYEQQPDNIIEFFLQYMRVEGNKDRSDETEKLNFKLKSQKVIHTISDTADQKPDT